MVFYCCTAKVNSKLVLFCEFIENSSRWPLEILRENLGYYNQDLEYVLKAKILLVSNVFPKAENIKDIENEQEKVFRVF